MNKDQQKKEFFGLKSSNINKIEVDKTKLDIDYKLKLFDSKGTKIIKFSEVKENKIVKAELEIILYKNNPNAKDNDEAKQVVYHLQDTDFKINEGKIIIDGSNRKSFENKLKKAYQRFIQENPKNTTLKPVIDTTDVYFTFTENSSEITINLKKGPAVAPEKVITADDINIKLNWYTTRAMALEDTMKDMRQIIVSSPKENSSWRKNKGLIITVIFSITIITLTIIFWKKIRGWFKWGKKGKDNQEKLEIF